MEKEKIIEKVMTEMTSNKTVRRSLTQKSFFWFFHVFFGHYIEYEMAPFQKEMFHLAEDQLCKLLVIMAFRESGKSTIMNLAYVIWSIVGIQQKKFIIIISKTQNQAKNHFSNIKRELEGNNLLKSDLGPFKCDNEGNWGQYSLELIHLNARIICISKEQGIRGLRHNKHRPDLIICDDLEDSVSVRTKEDRDLTYKWFLNEVFASANTNTKIIVLGNLLHEDSFLMRLRKDILQQKREGIFRAYPIVDDKNKSLWIGRFKSRKDLNLLESNISDSDTWTKEYLLKIRPGVILIMDMPFEKYDKKKNKLPKLNYQKPIIQTMTKYKISAPIKIPAIVMSEEELNMHIHSK